MAIAGCAAVVAIGCSTATSSSAATDSPASGLNDDPNAGAVPSFAAEDAGPPKAALYRGNPLCNVMSGQCMPDDDGSRLTSGAMSCGDNAVDAGDAGDAGTGSAAAGMGCRVRRETAATFAPRCLPNGADAGGDGTACKTGADCAAGFDCVVGQNGTTQCRHYCCAGTCKGHESQSGGATFCDVQDLVDAKKAPVCMPLKHCELLGMGECNANESCAVVTESGDTGCVSVGEKQVGASCDVDHCAAGLTCLGTAGSRQCFKLCKVSSSECGSAQVCTTSTVFKDPNFGICQKP